MKPLYAFIGPKCARLSLEKRFDVFGDGIIFWYLLLWLGQIIVVNLLKLPLYQLFFQVLFVNYESIGRPERVIQPALPFETTLIGYK